MGIISFRLLLLGKKRRVNCVTLGGTEDPNCVSCPLCNWCNTCYGFNYLLTRMKDHSICKMMFVQALAASEYQLKRVDAHYDINELDKVRRVNRLLWNLVENQDALNG